MTRNLSYIRVQDVMRQGILSCDADAPLGEVAAMMARNRVHAIAVRKEGGLRPVGVVFDHDVVAAMASGAQPTAMEAAATEPLAVSAGDSVRRAAQLMTEQHVSHLVVNDARSGYPIGIVSTLDLAAVMAR